MFNRHYNSPPIVTGYPLDYAIELVVPLGVDVTNISTNPSIEIDTAGWAAAAGAALSQNSSFQRRGTYSLRVIPTANVFDGAYADGGLSFVVGTVYSISFDFWGAPGVKYFSAVYNTGGVSIGPFTSFVGKGYWERIHILYPEITGTAARRLYIQKNSSASLAAFYIDGLLVVAQPYKLRYFDGDTAGYTVARQEFYWTGVPHASTSVMTAQTRAGGKLVSLAEYGFTLLAMLGLGLGPVSNLSQKMALTGGARYSRSTKPARSFDLVGFVSGADRSELEVKLSQLEYDLDPSRMSYDQPLVMQYQPVDDCKVPIGDVVDIVCHYAGGLEGGRDNNYLDNLDLKFDIFLPYTASLDGGEGGVIASRATIANAGCIVYRTPAGIWKAAGAGLSSTVYAILKIPDGRYLIGGNFQNAGGDANADFLAYYNPAADTFTAAVTAAVLLGPVYSLSLLPNGLVGVGGLFAVSGSRPQNFRLYDPATSTFVNMINTTDINGPVYAQAVLPDNTLVVGGNFTNAGGDPNADYIAKLNYTTAPYPYTALSTTLLNATVYALELGRNNILWVGGDFLNVGAVANQDYLTAMKSPYTTFSYVYMGAAGSPLNGNVRTLLSRSDGSLVIGGGFTTAFGVTTQDYLMVAALLSLTPTLVLGSIVSILGINNTVLAAAELSDGFTAIGGAFTSAAGLALYDRLFQFSGSTIVPLDLDLPGVPSVWAIDGQPTGEAVIGFDTIGTAYTSGTTTITNTGSAPAFPIIVIKYSAAATVTTPLYSIRNLTTGQIISFNLSLLPGETIILDLRTGKKTMISNSRGNILGSILPGGNLTTFRLNSGVNVINVYADIAAAANITAYASWVPLYSNIDSVVRR